MLLATDLLSLDGFKEVFDWAGRMAAVGALAGFLAAWILRRMGYGRLGFTQEGDFVFLPADPLAWLGYWTLAGIALGVVIGVFDR